MDIVEATASAEERRWFRPPSDKYVAHFIDVTTEEYWAHTPNYERHVARMSVPRPWAPEKVQRIRDWVETHTPSTEGEQV